jgi:1-acyl-sn-glycerol-3-phosphate acyltransferase
MTVLRSALFNLFFFLESFVLVLAGTVLRVAAPQRIVRLGRFWARLTLGGARAICGIRVQVVGLEHMPDGAALLASQHQSAFDTLVWLLLLPRCCYVLKQELLRIPLFGPLIPFTGMIAVDRQGGAPALRRLMRDGARAAREGRQIVIFPEGTRAAPGAMLPLQPGVAALAASTGLPVIPVVTDSGLYWGRRAFRKRPGKIRIRLLPPLPAGLKREELMQRLEAALRAGVDGPAG